MPYLERLKRACRHSLTVFWGYCLLAFGMAMEALNAISLVLNDPQIAEGVSKLLGASPRALALFSAIAGLGAIAARLRSLIGESRERL